jgi:hypothetical protein
MMPDLINHDAFKVHLLQSVNEAMKEAAEPVIEKALKEIEITMRETLAQKLISMIDSNISMERYGTDLRITIRQAEPS